MPSPLRLHLGSRDLSVEELMAAFLEGRLSQPERARLLREFTRHPETLEVLAYVARVTAEARRRQSGHPDPPEP